MMKVRFFAEKVGSQWQAFCIDMNLAVQADTLQDAQKKIIAMVKSYVELAKEQNDPRHQRDMLFRPAPLSIQLRYWYVWLRCNLARNNHHNHHHADRFSVGLNGQAGYC
ncbi:hypothetical protein ACFCQI_14280 [Rhodanobacter sp. FW102-FHT14D06]|uniref:Uncharacterized protein n=2 Tax=unclassified Rhodanobacter TaxID=2621553 RepID=A0AB74V050_9GAMM